MKPSAAEPICQRTCTPSNSTKNNNGGKNKGYPLNHHLQHKRPACHASGYKLREKGKKKDLIFTGDGKALKTVLLRAVHTKENGKKIRFTMIGQGGSGFAIAWENKEVTIDAELTAIKKVKGFLASFEEELTEEEAAAIVAA